MGLTTAHETQLNLAAEVRRLEAELDQMTSELIGVQDQLLAVFDLARAARRRLSLDAVLIDLVGEVQRLAGAELAFIVLADARTRELVCHPPVADDLRVFFEAVHHWITTFGSALVANAPTDLPGELTAHPPLHSLVCVPVMVDGKSDAVVGVMNRETGDFSAGTVKLLEALSEQAGGIVETSLRHEQALVRERLEHEMKLAAEIQAGLMAHALPQMSGIELVGRYRPAAEVGGDFYDARVRKDGQLSFAVADVSGKGLPAAMLMGISRMVLRACGLLTRRPSRLVDQANIYLYEDLTEVGNFVTAFAGLYQPRTRTLAYANAGHSPVIYRPRGGPATLLHATCAPLGVLADLHPDDDSVPLGPEDLLVVATDGFTEATGSDEQLFGYERLLHVVEDLAHLPAAVLADELFAAVDQFNTGRPQDDDQTLMIIKGVDE